MIGFDASVEVKKRKLEEDFQIPMTQEIEQGVKHMCNLSDGIEQRGIERGIKRGIERGRIEPIIKKVQKNKSIEVIADELECTVDDISESYDIVVKYAGVCSVDDVVKELNK